MKYYFLELNSINQIRAFLCKTSKKRSVLGLSMLESVLGLSITEKKPRIVIKIKQG